MGKMPMPRELVEDTRLETKAFSHRISRFERRPSQASDFTRWF